MKRTLVILVLASLLASLALAQTTDSHTVTVRVPSVLRLTLDATDYLFDFNSTATGLVETHPRASLAAYDLFLDSEVATQRFAPSSVTGGAPGGYGTVTIRTNRATWILSISSVTGTLPTPLGNARVSALTTWIAGGGTFLTGSAPIVGPAPPPPPTPPALITASAGGQGRQTFRLFYFLDMHLADTFPLAPTYDSNININLLLASP